MGGGYATAAGGAGVGSEIMSSRRFTDACGGVGYTTGAEATAALGATLLLSSTCGGGGGATGAVSDGSD